MEFLTLVSLIYFCSVVCKNLTCTWCFLLIFVRTMKNKHVRNLSLTCEIDYDLNFWIFYFNLSSARVSSTIIVDIYFPFIIFKYSSVFRPISSKSRSLFYLRTYGSLLSCAFQSTKIYNFLFNSGFNWRTAKVCTTLESKNQEI